MRSYRLFAVVLAAVVIFHSSASQAFGLRQWYIYPPQEGKALEAMEPQAAYEALQKLSTERDKFAGQLYYLHALLKSETDPEIAALDCKGKVRSCLLQNLAAIAKTEAEPAAKNAMYSELSTSYAINGDTDNAIKYLDMISDKKQWHCYFDNCASVTYNPVHFILKNKDCDKLISKGDYIQGSRVKSKSNGMHLLGYSEPLAQCMYSSGKYEDVSKIAPEDRDAYYGFLVIAFKRDNKIPEAMKYLAKISKPEIRANKFRLAFSGVDFMLDGLSEKQLQDYKQAFALMDADPVLQKDTYLWADILVNGHEDARWGTALIPAMQPYYKNWPEFKAGMDADPFFEARMCAYRYGTMKDIVESDDRPALEYLPPEDYGDISPERHQGVYLRCIAQLFIPRGEFDKAKFVADTYLSQQYSVMTRQAIAVGGTDGSYAGRLAF